jgi:hypothetical protein
VSSAGGCLWSSLERTNEPASIHSRSVISFRAMHGSVLPAFVPCHCRSRRRLARDRPCARKQRRFAYSSAPACLGSGTLTQHSGIWPGCGYVCVCMMPVPPVMAWAGGAGSGSRVYYEPSAMQSCWCMQGCDLLPANFTPFSS